MYKYSIIITVYNKDNVMKRCIQSVIDQTVSDIEIILVDDGSIDESATICDWYQAQYPNIVAIHQRNQGVAEARNTGLGVAKGEFITFIDADDYLEPDLFEKVDRRIQNESGIDMVSWGCIERNQELQMLAKIPMEDRVFSSKREAYLDINQRILGYVWLWTIRLEMIVKNSIRFNSYLEPIDDYYFVLQSIEAARQIATVANTFYHYVRSNSLNSLSKRIPAHVFEQHKKISLLKYQLLQDLGMDEDYIRREMKLAAYAAFKNGVKQLFRANEPDKVHRIAVYLGDSMMEKWFFSTDCEISIKNSEQERYQAVVDRDCERLYLLFKKYEEEKVAKSEDE